MHFDDLPIYFTVGLSSSMSQQAGGMRNLFRPLLIPGFTITGFTINRNELNAEPFASVDSTVIVGA
ncbi:MAG TPA: hypothetical protein DD672_03950 [Gammaproteobacteria bacterium]|nr:hypothetical protein [Gammaproteobacteria bacterium]